MPTHIALLRAVNVGGTGKLPMSDLRTLCEELGFTDVQTYIQSGNVVFKSRSGAKSVKAALEKALHARLGKPSAVLMRTHEELSGIEAANPFPQADPSRVLVLFLDSAPDKKAIAAATTPGGEQIVAGSRELYLFFPNGMGQSKLKIPLAAVGTGRNINTVRALLRMSGP